MRCHHLSLNVENKANHYRVLCIEPFGFKYGMEADEAFTVNFTGNDNLKFYIGDTDEDIIFTFEDFEYLDIHIFSGEEEISDKHNLNVL